MDKKQDLISKFETGDKPTGEDFLELIELCFNENKEFRTLKNTANKTYTTENSGGIEFDTVSFGNLEYNQQKTGIFLKEGKAYQITFNVDSVFSSEGNYCILALYDYTNEKNLDEFLIQVSKNGGSNETTGGSLDVVYVPDEDVYVGIKIEALYGEVTFRGNHTRFNIVEI